MDFGSGTGEAKQWAGPGLELFQIIRGSGGWKPPRRMQSCPTSETPRAGKRHIWQGACVVRIPMAILVAVAMLAGGPARAAEADAVAISAGIQGRHMPFGTILDPMYASPTSNQIVGYTRCGDSALWTGAYLAAEAFRYKVTRSGDAFNNVKTALAGLKGLADVTGDNRLARCMVLANSQYAAGIESEEAANTIHPNGQWVWVDNTSRDQVVGAFFGLDRKSTRLNSSH